MAKPLVILPADIRKLAGRIATERHRKAIWADGAKLRADALDRFRQGADLTAVRTWLGLLLEAALARQVE